MPGTFSRGGGGGGGRREDNNSSTFSFIPLPQGLSERGKTTPTGDAADEK